ncbi:MAG: Hsp70 family protein [Planctomycetes bacterium]|nr:Hsp70 family protein [Planctomycetota bacterium]
MANVRTTSERTSTGSDPVIGIDLGTTCSIVAWVDATGRPSSLMNADGDLSTPSVVFLDRSGWVVGREALKAAEFEPERVARFARRNVEPSSLHNSQHEPLPPEVIQALILKKLREDASLRIGPVTKAVIAVPAWFDEPRRKATEDAARLAGLEVLDILNESTAAAICFGAQQNCTRLPGRTSRKETALVFDLGGGTLDVTLMEIDGQSFTALATGGDIYLGGNDWTERLVDLVAARFLDEFDIDPRDDESSLQGLIAEAENAKRALTARAEVTLMHSHEGCRLRTTITRDEFEALTGDLRDRTLFTVNKVLREARVSWRGVTRLLLAGGASRMPAVRRALEAESGLQIDPTLSADEAVAHGAAVYAAQQAAPCEPLESEEVSLHLPEPAAEVTKSAVLPPQKMGPQRRRRSSKEKQEPPQKPTNAITVRNVNSHDLGVLGVKPETGQKRRRIMIPRNSRLPCRATSQFKTFRDGQQCVDVKVVEGGDDDGNGATRIGKCRVVDLPPDLAAETPVDVTFHYTRNGRIIVEAHLPTLGRKAEMVIERASGLDEKQLDDWQKRIDRGLVEKPAERRREKKRKKKNTKTAKRLEAAVPAPEVDSQPVRQDPELADTESTLAESVSQHTETSQPERATSRRTGELVPQAVTAVEDPLEQLRKRAEAPVESGDADSAGTAAASETLDESAALVNPFGDFRPDAPVDSSDPVIIFEEACDDVTPDSEFEFDSQTPVVVTPPDIKLAGNSDQPADDVAEQKRTLKAMFVNIALHSLLLLILARIIIPPAVNEQIEITSWIVEPKPDRKPEEVVVAPDPEQPESEPVPEPVAPVETPDLEPVDMPEDETEMPARLAEPPTDGGSETMAVAESPAAIEETRAMTRAELVRQYGGTEESEAAVAAGLNWLRQHQRRDGSWRFHHTTPQCDASCDQAGDFRGTTLGSTALTLLACMGAGNNSIKGELQPSVEAGLKYMLSGARLVPAGLDLRADSEGDSALYVQAIATICLCAAAALADSTVNAAERGT